ncbi:Zn-dependent protease with chaperone function [Povalibacter uvarum]|uniref:Zn-dependent protease with chaperone function n=1 Tax=Povalibacter uvarum TaxID=732238 RepID=A0A841HPS6_9GAMM|nr:M48 family metallopeptidase [Povalibacter uvarum]MBB6094118.1 Zn-dependent protease with chaperone function [Povalibacter uvarum]
MNQEAYENFVARIEAHAREHPSLYRLKLGGLAVLGYAYVAAILAMLLLVLGGFGWMILHGSGAVIAAKLGIFVIPLVWAVLTAMFVRVAPPVGRVITREEAPALFALVDDVRRKTSAPRADTVLVTHDFNAAVVQHPRLGVFGWPRNYLVLGLPLMQALSVEEFRTVVAHEFGHLSGQHGKFGAWIYRLRAGWARLSHALEESDHWGQFLFVPFFKWYAPTFGAYSFVQARRQEYEADRMAAATAGAGVAGAALVRVELQAQFLQSEYWKNIFREADEREQPQAQPFSMLRHAFTQPRPHGDASVTLESALKRRTGFDDTHPCLADRLNALGASAALPGTITVTAAETLLGTFGATLEAEFDRLWHENVRDWWRERHQYATESRSRLAELEAAAATGELSIDDALNRASLTEELMDSATARPLYEAVLQRAPENAAALFAVGRLKLDNDDDAGIELLRQAGRLDQTLAQVGGFQIVEYLRRHGRDTEARSHLDDLSEAGQRDELARRERGQLLTSDTLLPHELPTATVQEIVEKLRTFPEVRNAWLVRKKTQHYAHLPFYVLAVRRKNRWWKLESSQASQHLVDALCAAVKIPGDAIVFCVDGDNKQFRSKFKKVPGGEIYFA